MYSLIIELTIIIIIMHPRPLIWVHVIEITVSALQSMFTTKNNIL